LSIPLADVPAVFLSKNPILRVNEITGVVAIFDSNTPTNPSISMKAIIRFAGSALLLGAVLTAAPALAGGEKLPGSRGNQRDTLAAVPTMRVVFLPGSTPKNFRIGIEANQRCAVNIQVINKQGMVVYSDVIEKVTKKIEERDFSWLKRGEYTVKVMNQDSEYKRTLTI